MQAGSPSRTAERVALRRAAHQLLDQPRVFEDAVALRIVGNVLAGEIEADPGKYETSRASSYLRAFVAVRSRCAEDELANAVRRGVRQYVVMGAGLDTFAYRNPFSACGLRVFEVDYPATQAWKQARLTEMGIGIPEGLTFVPVDFESQTAAERLAASGHDPSAPSCFSWLGVTPYLETATVMATFRWISELPVGSGVTFDYAVPRESMSPDQVRAFDALARTVAVAGEPFLSFFDTDELASCLSNIGFSRVVDSDSEALNAAYFRNRTDGLRVSRLSHVMSAWV